MTKNNKELNSPKISVSAGRNIAFVQGPEKLLKTTSLFYEYVFSVSSLLEERSIIEIKELNRKGSRFVEVYEGRNAIDGNGKPGKMHLLRPSYFGFKNERDEEAILVEMLTRKGRMGYFLSVSSKGQLKDISYVKEIESTNSNYLNNAIDEFPGIALSNVPIFDIEGCSWDHIKDFREDPTALKCMRNIRLFVRDNFEGRSLGYIQDKLGYLVDAQERISKYHGIALYKGVLIDVLQDSLLHTALTSSIVLAITGNDRAALGAAVTTLALGVGKISVSFSQKLDNKKLLEANEPVNYLIKMKESLSSHMQ